MAKCPKWCKISLMGLSKKQKKYLKKNLKRFSLANISVHLNVSEEEILNFLKSHWRKEKYQKFLAGCQTSQSRSTVAQHHPCLAGRQVGGEFNLKKWLKQNWKIFAFLALLVLAVYFNSLGNDFLSDDIGAIKDNPEINKVSYFWKPPYFNINPRSLVIFLTNKILGKNPAFFRLSNIFLHLISTWIIYLLISFFLKPPIPLATASIFAVHPILTESVTWISGGPYSFYSFFFLCSFLAYLLAKKDKKIFFISILAFVLSLLSSDKAISLFLVFLLFEVSFGKLRQNWKKLVPYFILNVTLGLIYLGKVGQRITDLQTAHYQEPKIINPLTQIPIAITDYLRLIFWPINLTLYHSEMRFNQGEYFIRLIIFIVFLGIIAFAYKKNRHLVFWLSFFIICLLPTLTPFGISWIVAERYTYLGALGIIVIIALVIQKIGEIVKSQKISLVLLVIIILALSLRTIVRNTDWKNQDTLWLATAKTSPSSPQNHNNLGDLYFRHGNLEKAAEEFKKAIELQPNYGDAYHNLANAYHQMGKDDLAEKYYLKALSFNPNLWQSYQNLGAIYFQKEEYDLAQQNLKKAIEINPNPELYLNLGILYLKLDEKEKAKKEFQTVLRLDPENQKAKEMLRKYP